MKIFNLLLQYIKHFYDKSMQQICHISSMKFMLLITLIFSMRHSVSHATENTLQSILIYNEAAPSISVDKMVEKEEYDHSSIRESISESIDDILRISPGATTSGGPRSSGEQIMIRGLTSKKLFTYIDGVKQGFSTDHSTMLALDTDNLKKIEIYKSTSAISKGGSIGGGMILTTKDARDYLRPGEKLGSLFKFSHQTSNDERYFSAKTFSHMNDNDFLLSIASREAKNTILSDRTTLLNSNYKDINILTKYSFQTSKNDHFKISYEVFKREDSAPLNPTSNPPLSIKELNGDNKIMRKTINLLFTNNPKNNRYLNLHSNFYITNQSLEKIRLSDKQYEMRRITTKGIAISNRSKLKYMTIDNGIELIEDDLTGQREGADLASYPSGRSVEKSFFTQFSIPVGGHLEVITGARFQAYNLETDNPKHRAKSAFEISKKVSAILSLAKGLKLSMTYSEGFNAPKIQDIYVDGLHHQGDGFFIADNFFITNYDLSHETSKMLEVGMKYEHNLFTSDDLLTLKINQYWNQAHNYIYYEKVDRAIIDGEVGTTQFINIPNVNLRGREFGIDYLNENIETAMTYSQVRGVNKNKSLYLADMPADQYTFSLKYHFFKEDITIGYLGISTLKQDRVNSHTIERTDETPAYFTHDIFLTKDFKEKVLNGLSLTGRINNLTNRRYRKHASNINEIGLDLKMSVSYKYKLF